MTKSATADAPAESEIFSGADNEDAMDQFISSLLESMIEANPDLGNEDGDPTHPQLQSLDKYVEDNSSADDEDTLAAVHAAKINFLDAIGNHINKA